MNTNLLTALQVKSSPLKIIRSHTAPLSIISPSQMKILLVAYHSLEWSDSAAEILPDQVLPKDPGEHVATRSSCRCQQADERETIPHTKQSTRQHILQPEMSHT